jgi:hypothetical protein
MRPLRIFVVQDDSLFLNSRVYYNTLIAEVLTTFSCTRMHIQIPVLVVGSMPKLSCVSNTEEELL